MMKNGQYTKKCKVYSVKSAFARNLQEIMSKKNLTIQDVANKAGVSRQTIYNWINGAVPRKDTIAILSCALGVSEDTIKYGNKVFDYYYFCEKATKLLQNTKYKNDSLYDFLIIECNVDPSSFFIKHMMPTEDTKIEIARKLNCIPEDIFKTYGIYASDNGFPKLIHYSVLSDSSISEDEILTVYNNLNPVNQKIIFNLCQDLLVAQS